MVSLIIADDEAIERRALKLLIQKNFPEIEISGLASNGIELIALTESKQPDIAIVDITMPGMNGLDTIELLQARKTRTRFIVNTAYSEFEFAQKALALKVDAYMLKPQKQEITIETIRKLYSSIREHNASEESHQQLAAVFEQIVPIIENELMYSIFLGTPSADSFEKYLEMHALHFGCGAMVTIVPAMNAAVQLRQADADQIRRCLDDTLNGRCSFISNIAANNLCLFFFRERFEPLGWKSWMLELLSLTLENLHKKLGLKLRAGAGNCYSEFSEMEASYKESLQALKADSADATVFYEDLEGGGLAQRKREAIAKVEIADNSYVGYAMKYIETMYSSPISLEAVAEKIGVSSYYLSRLFKQESGQTFLEYLTKVRIQHAALLSQNTRLSVNEIAGRVGYGNPAYFCRVYKKYTGKSISEDRDETRRKKMGEMGRR